MTTVTPTVCAKSVSFFPEPCNSFGEKTWKHTFHACVKSRLTSAELKLKAGQSCHIYIYFLFHINVISSQVLNFTAVQDGEMVQCCNHRCSGAWFHLPCVDLQEAPEGDWYCSDDCRDSGGYIYCICHSRKEAEDQHMLKCALGDSCHRHGLYHPSCIGADPAVIQGYSTLVLHSSAVVSCQNCANEQIMTHGIKLINYYML